MYGTLTEEEIDHYFQLNIESDEKKLQSILNKMTKAEEIGEIQSLIGQNQITISNKEQIANVDEKKTLNIDDSIRKMFNHL